MSSTASLRGRTRTGERSASTVGAIATALDVQQRQHLSIEDTLSNTYERGAHYWSSTTASICEAPLRRSPSEFSAGVPT